MKVISIGDLVTDYYYKNNKLVGVSGGMSSHNIIANITKMELNTAVFGWRRYGRTYSYKKFKRYWSKCR